MLDSGSSAQGIGLAVLILLAATMPAEAGTVGRAVGIRWEQSTLQLVQAGAGYGRMIRLDDEAILCLYERAGSVHARLSRDNARHWADETLVASYPFGTAANPEALQLKDGRVMAMWNERPRDGMHHFAIRIAFSKDLGQTWANSQLVYQASSKPHNGCWEPAAIQLPSGEIELFFANEYPYPHSNEQEITMLRSHDDGATWSGPETVSFRPGGRDGMPVPLVLNNRKGIVVAIEDSGDNGVLQPSIIYTSLSDDWKQGPAGANSPRRWPAVSGLDPHVYAGAPYIRQLPTGETILSCQSTEGRTTDQMVVYIGDSQARNFAARSVPFQIRDGEKGQWNSLFVKDESTVTAISSAVINGHYGLWAIDGYVIRAH